MMITVANPNFMDAVHRILMEDEYFTAIENRDTAIMMRDKKIAEKDGQLAEKDEQLAATITKIKKMTTCYSNKRINTHRESKPSSEK